MKEILQSKSCILSIPCQHPSSSAFCWDFLSFIRFRPFISQEAHLTILHTNFSRWRRSETSGVFICASSGFLPLEKNSGPLAFLNELYVTMQRKGRRFACVHLLSLVCLPESRARKAQKPAGQSDTQRQRILSQWKKHLALSRFNKYSWFDLF